MKLSPRDAVGYFQKPDPQEINYHVNTWFDDTDQQLGKVVLNYMLKQQGKQTERL